MIPKAKKNAQDIQNVMKQIVTASDPMFALDKIYGTEYVISVESDGTHVVHLKDIFAVMCKPTGEVFINNIKEGEPVPNVPILTPISSRTLSGALLYLSDMKASARAIRDLLPPSSDFGFDDKNIC